MLASTTFVAHVIAARHFIPLLLFYLPVISARATSSNFLVPPTIATYEGIGPLGSCGRAPLAEGPGGQHTLKG